MPRSAITRDSFKVEVLKLKSRLDKEYYPENEKAIAHRYLNLVLDKLDEYRY